jgi:Fic family protein
MGMLTLRPQTFQALLSPATAWLLADCMEMRGKQDLWTRQRPETLAALREQAIVHSVESSNRIEGVTVAPQRLRPLALRRTRPRDRSEEELAGYRKALDWIFARSSRVAVDQTLILHLHDLAQGGTTGDAGRFKEKDNEIIELKPGVGRVVRFRPTPAKEAPRAIRELCASFELLSSERAAPPLLLVATFVFDFLCIHPFRDGNGRVSRLLTTLLLEREGFVVSQFVSLERLIEETKEDYYRVLGTCSQRWSEGRNPIAPWWTYFLSIVRRGYTAFAGKVDRPIAGGTKTELVRQAAMGQVGAFALADLRAELPAVSPQMIRKVLADLRDEGALRSSGRGRAARWEIIRK